MARSTSTDGRPDRAVTAAGTHQNCVLAADASSSEKRLWSRIEAHRFDNSAVALDFVARLARDHGGSRGEASTAIEEYRRFCFLATVMPEAATPSPSVDEVWHLHLTYTRDYWDQWCGAVLLKPLHHQPTAGGKVEDQRYRAQYAETLAGYQRYFGPPPEPFWPSSQHRFQSSDRFRWIDRKKNLVLPRPLMPARSAWLIALLTLLVAPLALALPLNPMDWRGGPFLALYSLLIIVTLLVMPRLRRMLAPRQWTGTPPKLDAYEIAYLEGGEQRVVDAGIADLLAKGWIVVDAKSAPRVLGQPPGLPAPLPALYAAIAQGDRFSRLPKAIGNFIDALRHRLILQGLVLGPGQRRALNLKVALLPVAISGLGLLKIGIGLSRDRPVGILILLNVIMLLITLAALFNRKDRSATGETLLAELKQQHRHATLAPRREDLALAVALVGTQALAGTAWADYHAYRSSTSSGSSDCGSSSGGDGGSGCGSGCGGCGGS